MISEFKGEYRWLSNFYIEPDGTCVEREFQIEKHRGLNPWRAVVIDRCGPKRARRFGKKFKLSNYQQMEWDHRRLQVMYQLVKKKVEDHPDIAFALIATDDEILVEKNHWHDNYWGDCQCLRCFRIGENHLGEIWMALRDEFDAEVVERTRRAA